MCSVQEWTGYHSTILENSGPCTVTDTYIRTVHMCMCSRTRVSCPIHTSHTAITHMIIRICMYMYVYVCICMYMYVYVCICMYMYVYVCIVICRKTSMWLGSCMLEWFGKLH